MSKEAQKALARAFLQDLNIAEPRINDLFVANRPILDYVIVLRSQLAKQDSSEAFDAIQRQFPKLMAHTSVEGNILELLHDVAVGLLELGADPLLEFPLQTFQGSVMFTPFGDAIGKDWRLIEAMTASEQFDATYTYPRTNPESIPAHKRYTTAETLVLAMISAKDDSAKKGTPFSIPDEVINALQNILTKAPEFILTHRCLTDQSSLLEMAVKHLPEVLDIILEADNEGVSLNTPNPLRGTLPFIQCLEMQKTEEAITMVTHSNLPTDQKDEFFQQIIALKRDLAEAQREGKTLFAIALESGYFGAAYMIAKSPTFNHPEKYVGSDGCNFPLLLATINDDVELFKSLLSINPDLLHHTIEGIPQFDYLANFLENGQQDFAIALAEVPGFDVSLSLKSAMDSQNIKLLHKICDLIPNAVTTKIEGKTLVGYAESVLLQHRHEENAAEIKETTKHLIAELISHGAEVTDAAKEIAKALGLDITDITSHTEEWHVELLADMMKQVDLSD